MDFINDELKKKSALIMNEVDFILKYEFKEIRNYKSILEGISKGKNTIKEISDYVYMNKSDVMPYLRNLIDIGIVKREIPIFSKTLKK